MTLELWRLRQRVASSTVTAPLSVGRREDFVLAVNEVATNALQYGREPRITRLWQSDGNAVAEVVARGHIDDPMAGSCRPDPQAPRGRGLWIAGQLCDLVQLCQEDETTRLRLHMQLG